MLNFPKSQSQALSHVERRENEPPDEDQTTMINHRPTQRPCLDSPAQHQTGTHLTAPMKPVVRVLDPAPPAQWGISPPVARPSLSLTFFNKYQPRPQLVPDCDRPAAQVFEQAGSMGSIASTTVTMTTTVTTSTPAVTGPVSDGEDMKSVNDDVRFEWLARRVCDAKQVKLAPAINTIREADLNSPSAATAWFQLGALLCLHYDAQEDKEHLSQCIEQLLLRMGNLQKRKHTSGLYNTAKDLLLAACIPADFIRIMQRARNSEWHDGRLNTLIKQVCIVTNLKLALEQVTAGRRLEKTAQQAAAEFLLARQAARNRDPAFTPMTTASTERIDSTDSFGGPVPSSHVPPTYRQHIPLVSANLSSGAAVAAAVPMPPQRTWEPPVPLDVHEPVERPRQASVAMIEAIIELAGHKRIRIDEPVERKRQRIDEVGASIVSSASSINRLGVTRPPMSAGDGAHLESIDTPFSACEDVMTQQNKATLTLLASFPENTLNQDDATNGSKQLIDHKGALRHTVPNGSDKLAAIVAAELLTMNANTTALPT